MKDSLAFLNEPRLLFGYGQSMEDPRDGLTLFGPLELQTGLGLRVGVVGTPAGVRLFRSWLESIQQPIPTIGSGVARAPFPGFQAAFRLQWSSRTSLELTVTESTIDEALRISDRHRRIFTTVGIFTDQIEAAIRERDEKVDLWFVIIPDKVYLHCRPKSGRAPGQSPGESGTILSPTQGKRLQLQPSLFSEDNKAAVPYGFDVDFRNQLKCRLLDLRTATQIVKESTIELSDPSRDLVRPDIAWHLATAAYYKSGRRPWKLEKMRPGVCYLGLVFKRDSRSVEARSACCAAQMFLDSGDGVVFKGALGPWYQPVTKSFHLSRLAASEILLTAIESYKQLRGEHPKEVFIHGRTKFDKEEWLGFCDASTSAMEVSTIRITTERDLRLYRSGKMPIIRGSALIRDERSAYLWSKGFAPRLGTYVGREVPLPLLIERSNGQTDIETILEDVFSLTKLNYNACRLGDGEPITLKFADAVGEILTAGPTDQLPPLPFKFYI